MQETQVRFLGWEDPLEKEMALSKQSEEIRKKKKTEKKKSGLALVMSAKIGFKEKKITMDIGHYIIIKEQHSKKTY